jgi:bifunctional non-homologous end joining protein LigD
MKAGGVSTGGAERYASYPDFVVFDLDPYIYSGKEAAGAEPELNPAAFRRTCQVALKLKEALDSLSFPSFVKTSGRTGLHIFVPVLRKLDFHGSHAAAETISRFLSQQHPSEVTVDWPVGKRTGKVFLDYNQNVRGKTLVSLYSPRPSPQATVSVPLRWDELDEVYPTDFTILTVPGRLAEMGDLWAGILNAKINLSKALTKASSIIEP